MNDTASLISQLSALAVRDRKALLRSILVSGNHADLLSFCLSRQSQRLIIKALIYGHVCYKIEDTAKATMRDYARLVPHLKVRE